MPSRFSITIKQQEYIEQLCIDLVYTSKADQKELISDIVDRDIKFLDDLSMLEANVVITRLKKRKEVMLKNKRGYKGAD